MTETRTARAERVLERLDLRLGGGGLPVDAGHTLVYAAVGDWLTDGDVVGTLGVEQSTEPAGFPGVVYDVPTFGVTVLVFDAGVLACPDAADPDVAGAAIRATVTKLAGTPVESAAAVDVRTVSLTAGPDGAWEAAVDGGLDEDDAPGETAGEEAGVPGRERGADDAGDVGSDGGEDAVGDEEADATDPPDGGATTGVGVTPPPCAGCGRVPDGWERHCPRCGTDLKPETCAACGSALARWMLYCPACGADATGSGSN
jgi:hypothetical protein